MGIEPNFDPEELRRFLRNGVEAELHRKIVRNLNYLGMQCVQIARTLDTYTDRTANLRNSIGYLIMKDGQVISSTFQTGTGGENGKNHAQSVAQNHPTGYALIVVAGMEYASYVEDVHNLAVLAPAENFAKAKAQELMKRILGD